MICGLQSPSSGQVLINGTSLTFENRSKILKEIGSLIESPSYYGNLTGYENLEIVRDYKGLKNKDVIDALEIVGLNKQKDKKVKSYSLGMKQRLGIAMALIGFPKILILDEPTNGLDPQAMADIRELICSLPKRFGATVMISSHALDEIEKIAQKISILGRGHILYQGDIKNFKNQYQSDLHMETSNNALANSLLHSFSSELTQEGIRLPYLQNYDLEKALDMLQVNGIYTYRIFEKRRSLEELFLDFTQTEHL